MASSSVRRFWGVMGKPLGLTYLRGAAPPAPPAPPAPGAGTSVVGLMIVSMGLLGSTEKTGTWCRHSSSWIKKSNKEKIKSKYCEHFWTNLPQSKIYTSSQQLYTRPLHPCMFLLDHWGDCYVEKKNKSSKVKIRRLLRTYIPIAYRLSSNLKFVKFHQSLSAGS